MLKKTGCAVVVFLAVALATNVFAQGTSANVDYPKKPINTLIGFAPGGGSDVMISMVRPHLEKALKTTFVPTYKPGSGSDIALMELGIPFTPAMAVVMAVLLIHGINPGPLLMTEKPDLFWGVIASMYIGNFMLLVFNLPLVGVFASIIRTTLYLLMPIVLLLCLVGVYSVNNSMLDIWLMTGFGLLGYLLRRLKYDLAPLVLALVLGPMMERSFREAMMISRGDLSVFLSRPISATILFFGAIVLVAPLLIAWIKPVISRKA